MFKSLFSIILDLVKSLIKLILLPIDAVIKTALPDITTQVQSVVDGATNFFGSMNWGLSIIPRPVIIVLLFIMTCELAKITIFITSHSITTVWHIIQKIKFW